MIGTTIGNYQVLTLIAEGGMGSVYLAQHPGLGRRAAIKVLHPILATDPQVVSRFLTEARAANAIRHPNIVEVYDCGALPSGAPYLMMEFLDGETLSDRLRRGPLTLREAVEIAHQTAAGLAAAHSQGIVHRDLKPDNLFLTPDPRNPELRMVKILDFGIAKLQKPLDGLSHKTRTGVLMGTPVYMSPEQCLGLKEVDARSDIYSLGVILYQMLCGRPPFESEGVGALIHMHIGEAPRATRTHNPSIPPRLETAVMRALAKAPDDRYPTMDAFRIELAAILEQRAGLPDAHTPVPGKIAAPGPTTFSGEARRLLTTQLIRGRGRWLTVAAAALLLLGGAALWKLRSATPAMTGTQVALVDKPAAPQPAAPAPMPAPTPSPPPAPPPPTPAAPALVELSIDSEPAGATVAVGDVVIGQTPLTYRTRPTDETVEFSFTLEGHEREVVKALPGAGMHLKPRLAASRPAAVRPTSRKPATKRPALSQPSAVPGLNDIKTER